MDKVCFFLLLSFFFFSSGPANASCVTSLRHLTLWEVDLASDVVFLADALPDKQSISSSPKGAYFSEIHGFTYRIKEVFKGDLKIGQSVDIYHLRRFPNVTDAGLSYAFLLRKDGLVAARYKEYQGKNELFVAGQFDYNLGCALPKELFNIYDVKKYYLSHLNYTKLISFVYFLRYNFNGLVPLAVFSLALLTILSFGIRKRFWGNALRRRGYG